MDHTANYDKDKMSKLFTTGNSEAIRLRKKDTELLDLNPSDQFIKEISLDGRSISYNLNFPHQKNYEALKTQ